MNEAMLRVMLKQFGIDPAQMMGEARQIFDGLVSRLDTIDKKLDAIQLQLSENAKKEV
jgi:hypothetical protein